MINKIMVEMKNISKKYILGKTAIPAVKNVSFKISREDFTVFAGSSGSGKTTLLNIAGLIDKPDSGEIRFDGENITPDSLNSLFCLRRDHLGYIFQTFNLIPVLNVFENVEYPLILNNITYKTRKDIVNSMLEKVGIFDRRKHKPNELSGGQRQRVSIARAVVKNPKIVIADEPTANLDSGTGLEIIELMEKLNREEKITFVFSSHDPQIIEKGKKVIHLKDGEIAGINQKKISAD